MLAINKLTYSGETFFFGCGCIQSKAEIATVMEEDVFVRCWGDYLVLRLLLF